MERNLKRSMKLPLRHPTFNLWNGFIPEDSISPNSDFDIPMNDVIELVEISVAGLELVVSMRDELGFNDSSIATMQSDIDWAKKMGSEYITFCYF